METLGRGHTRIDTGLKHKDGLDAADNEVHRTLQLKWHNERGRLIVTALFVLSSSLKGAEKSRGLATKMNNEAGFMTLTRATRAKRKTWRERHEGKHLREGIVTANNNHMTLYYWWTLLGLGYEAFMEVLEDLVCVSVLLNLSWFGSFGFSPHILEASTKKKQSRQKREE